MARSLFSTRPRRGGLLARYFSETVNYGGEVRTRAEVIRDLRSRGADARCIDRYLQGADLHKALEAEHRPTTPLTTWLQ